ncbi:MAG: protein-export chaperone SecB [Methyloceanibacter sp.]
MAGKKETREPSAKRNGDGKPKAEPATEPKAAPTEGAVPRAGTGVQLNVLGQYIKDLSFENPGAPQALQAPPQNPQLQVTVNVNAGARPEETYEVTLKIEVHAKSDTGVIYNVEFAYGGLFRLRNVPQNLLQPVLFVDCPTILFPFLRRVLADVTRDGGFPPLMLDPIDFGRLYAQNLARAEGPGNN